MNKGPYIFLLTWALHTLKPFLHQKVGFEVNTYFLLFSFAGRIPGRDQNSTMRKGGDAHAPKARPILAGSP